MAAMEEEARAEWTARGFPAEEFAMAKLAEIWAAEEKEELAEACAAHFACTARNVCGLRPIYPAQGSPSSTALALRRVAIINPAVLPATVAGSRRCNQLAATEPPCSREIAFFPIHTLVRSARTRW